MMEEEEGYGRQRTLYIYLLLPHLAPDSKVNNMTVII